EMLSATGFYWDNPAVGFYRRDLNMPLDNLAVMCQTLLGTSIVCAQCHDHPFDTWTQKEYYEMAAYTFPMVTQLKYNDLDNVKQMNKMIRDDLGRQGARDFGREVRRARQNLIDYPLKSGVRVSSRRLKYPKDYEYSNAKPGSTVKPSTPFGKKAFVFEKEAPIAPFVKWFTSAENPRFAKNIANRLWKETFGLGLIEPHDDIREGTEAFHPELMDYLAQLLAVELKYDLKTYLTILHKTRMFQQAAYEKDVNPVDGYNFSGPLIRRLTAEQMWDSIVTLIVPDLDKRTNPSLSQRDHSVALQGKVSLETPGKTLYNELKKRKGKSRKELEKLDSMMMSSMMEGDTMMMASMNMGEMSMSSAYGKPAKKTGKKKDPYAGLSKKERRERELADKRKADPWFEYSRGYFRSAELPSPAPGGHFLNMFGQSDREVTENDDQFR
ncbi:MAG: DUF1553 domain-containing protein, partial [Verrucomicrobiota bacterium]